MNQTLNTGFAERLKTAAEAKKALLAKFQPKPTVVDPEFTARAERRAAELEKVRSDRLEARAAAKQAAADAVEAARLAHEATAEAELEAKRGERKERKALTKAEQKAKRDQRYAARKARQ
ncbi:DUF6481 family protein [Phenylobacterium aquaticum]|uniref:DUF6481 family protein n=1 Tax=Phenylobacterium aquaticum TaxID=1763816 RepID=UPI0026EC01D7|nr:DUF6481 family protein [Phenylobacterium aquaticum]